MATTPERATWAHPFTLADVQVIEGLDEETRAVVERYKRSYVIEESLHVKLVDDIRIAISYLDSAARDLRKAVKR